MTISFNKNLVPAAIVVAGLLIAGSLVAINVISSGTFFNKGSKVTVLSPEQAAEKAIKYINEQILQGKATASLVSVVEEGGLYKVKLGIGGKEYDSYITKDGSYLFPEGYKTEVNTGEMVQEQNLTIGNFSISQDEICREQEKPVVYYFGSASCPHCQWEKPILERVVAKFQDKILFVDNTDTDKNQDVFSKYSAGGIPTLVFGCKYYRVGSGEGLGEGEEEMALTALMCKLTGSENTESCAQVQELIGQIKE